ncbi:MAG: hypothetical protein HONBIEJF_01424 [Fimbriimonadaceae bacterium]|nr:hypothetical protein [Fimbriimonadaceae bacterium]
MRLVRFGFAVAAITSITTVSLGQDGVLLRRVLKPSTDTYNVKMKSINKMYIEQMGGDQEASVDGTMKVVVKVGDVDAAKKANAVELAFSDMKFELGGMAATAQGALDELPKTYKIKGFLDEMNRFTEPKLEGIDQRSMMMSGMEQMRNSFFFELPEKAVKVGDTWTIKLPSTAMIKKETPMECKFMGEETIDGTAAYKIEMKADMKIDADMSEMAGDANTGGVQMKMIMKGTNVMTTTLWMEKGTGRALKTETKVVGDQTMEMPDMNMTMPIKSETTATMTLAK